MTPEFITSVSSKIAKRYRNTSHYEDLVSKGVLAAYEEMGVNKEVTEKRIHQVINWAQWKFLNVSCLPVYMPENLVRKVKGMGSEGVETNYTQESLDWAGVILSQGQMQSDYHDIDERSNQEQELSKYDLLETTWDSARECLTDKEYDLFHAHFKEGLGQKRLGCVYKVTQQSISLRLSRIKEKVRKHVVNKKCRL